MYIRKRGFQEVLPAGFQGVSQDCWCSEYVLETLHLVKGF